MKCPECGAWTVVKETRADENNSRRRRIECANLHRFTTLETVIATKTQLRQKQKTAEISGKP
jgi:transcriptional regulator NrdR family protein